MEGATTLPMEAEELELWVYSLLRNRYQPSYIADELIKLWEKKRLSIEAKQAGGRFCIMNGFYAPVLRVLKVDLKSGDALPWPIVLEILMNFSVPISKELVDAILAGATRDKQLLQAAAEGMGMEAERERWARVFAEELKERHADFMQARNELLQEVQILQHEGMEQDAKDQVSKVLTLFPEDAEAKKIDKQLKEKNLAKSLEEIRKRHNQGLKPSRIPVDKADWPGLSKALKDMAPKLDLEGTYSLAIGLHEMDFDEDALTLLRVRRTEWSRREEVFELEILLALSRFAEALEAGQRMLKIYALDPEIVHASLYSVAKAYRGLEDNEQAVSIIRALLQHCPDYRDASVLLKEWES